MIEFDNVQYDTMKIFPRSLRARTDPDLKAAIDFSNITLRACAGQQQILDEGFSVSIKKENVEFTIIHKTSHGENSRIVVKNNNRLQTCGKIT